MVKKKSKSKKKTYSRKKKIKQRIPVYDYKVSNNCYEYYDLKTGEIYPKIFLKESLFIKLLRFLRLKP